MRYLERYEAGEDRRVWDELHALGPAALHGKEAHDIRKLVARTIERAAANLRLLADGLVALGYEFVAVSPGVPDSGSVNAAVLASGAEALLSHPGLSRDEVEKMLAGMPQLLGGLSGAGCRQSPPAPQSIPRASPFFDRMAHRGQIDFYERSICALPLSVGEFWRQLGGVDFTCRNPQGELQLEALAVLPPATLLNDHGEWMGDGASQPFVADLVAGPDLDQPPIGVDLSPGADARLETGEWFVDYLRRQLSYACLGLPQDKLPTEVRQLVEGCRPF